MTLGNTHAPSRVVNHGVWAQSIQRGSNALKSHGWSLTLSYTYSEDDSSKSLSELLRILENIFIRVEPSVISIFSSSLTILLTSSTMLLMLAEDRFCPSPVKSKIALAF